VAALREASANPAGSGPPTVVAYSGHILTINAAAGDKDVRALGRYVIACAEDLFVNPRDQEESQYRSRLLSAVEELAKKLRYLGLLD
jgi:hypothetical protein